MGEISPKLRKVLEMVKPEAKIPVIVELAMPLSKEVVSHLESIGLSVTEKIERVNMISGKIQASLVDDIARLPFVKTVYYDEPMTITGVPFFRIEGKDSVLVPVNDRTTGKEMEVDSVWFQYAITGKGVKVAVLDTGACLGHPMLRDAIVETFSTVKNESAEDGHGHGTWCAATIAGRPFESELEGKLFEVVGIAPEAELIIGKVLSNSGEGSTSQVMKGMEKAADLGADVISMSLGSMVSEGGRSPDAKMVDALAKEGIIVVVAAGNSALPLSIGSPGDARGAITVGSVSYQVPTMLMPSTFESRGPTVDLRLKPDCVSFGGNVLPNITELIVSAGKDYDLDAMAGTCLVKDTIVYTPDGPVELKDLKVGDTVYSFDENTGRVVVGKVDAVWKKGVKDTYEVYTKDGRKLIATGNHPILTTYRYNGKRRYRWIRVDKLKDYHAIVIPQIPENPVPELNELVTHDIARAPNTTSIKSIKLVGKEKVYDLTISPYPAFIASGIVVHNSMATPHVSGVAALLIEAGMPKDRDIFEYVLSKTGRKKIPIPFKDTDFGWGLPNIYNAISGEIWNSAEAQSFNFISEKIQKVTMPLSAMVEPIAVKTAQLIGIEMTPKLAVL